MRWMSFFAFTTLLISSCIPYKDISNVGLSKRESNNLPVRQSTDTVQYGKASWYGDKEHGNKTANGETFNRYSLTAAHKEIPFQSVVMVTNLENGKKVKVRINDRGPFVRGRVIDLSYAAAKKIGLIKSGVAEVKIEVLSTPSKRSESLFIPLYTVQAGSFSSRAKAYELRRKLLRVTDESIRVEPSDFRGNTYYRVRVGMFKQRKDAERLRSNLKRRGYSASIYVE